MLGFTSFKKNGPEVDRITREVEEAKERTRRRDEARRRGLLECEADRENKTSEDLNNED